MAELFISRRAEEELRQIWRYVAAENPAAADQLLLRIDEQLQFLRDFPAIGTLRDDIRPGFRMLVEGTICFSTSTIRQIVPSSWLQSWTGAGT